MTFAAIVLAAGHARRFGGNKMMAPLEGRPLIAHVLDAASAAPVETVLLICRETLDLETRDSPPPVEEVVIQSDAMSDSLRAGVLAAGDVEGAFVFLGDMPLVPHTIAERLARSLRNSYAAVPRCNGQPGHPVLFSRRAFADIAALAGDAGAGKLLRARDDVVFVDTDDEGVLLDVDSAADLARLSDHLTQQD